MAVNISGIVSTLKADLKSAATSAREVKDIDGSRDLYSDKVAEAVGKALTTFIAEAEVNGGAVPAGGGPITKGIIS